MEPIILAIDVMSGDNGPEVTLPACVDALKLDSSIHLLLVGDKNILTREKANLFKLFHARVEVLPAAQVVDMDESPRHALKNKKVSSMRLAIQSVKDRRAHACVSAGNTGALMAIAHFLLRTINGIDRPAFISEIPTSGQPTRMLDLGANISSDAKHLFQFAVMGTALVQAILHKKNPTVGLLNVGHEQIKGTSQIKETADLLKNSNAINFYGYIEGDEIYRGIVDIVVCDGFVGNVALKTTEGTARLISHYLKDVFSQDYYAKAISVVAAPIMARLKKQIDPARYNGASFLGLNGIVVKSHGAASVSGFTTAILEAAQQVRTQVPELIGKKIQYILAHEEKT